MRSAGLCRIVSLGALGAAFTLAGACSRDWSFLDAGDAADAAPDTTSDATASDAATSDAPTSEAPTSDAITSDAPTSDATTGDAASDAASPDAASDAAPEGAADGALDATTTPLLAVAVSGEINYGVTCTLRSGVAYCWGRNDVGQLGRGVAGDAAVLPAPVVGPDGGGTLDGVSRLTIGFEHACAVREGGVLCWGAHDFGDLGNNLGTDALLPTPARDVDYPLSGIRLATCGNLQCCALAGDGGLGCWGWDTIAQLAGDIDAGSQGYAPYAMPVGDPRLQSPRDVSMGVWHGCAATTDGHVLCWGQNDYRQAGQAVSDTCSNFGTPVPCAARAAAVGSLSGVVQVAAGMTHSCALDAGGAVSCWGRNADGELGLAPAGTTGVCFDGGVVDAGGEACTEVPQHALDGASQIAVGGHVSCAVQGGHVVCWGSDEGGMLGQGPGGPVSSAAPLLVKDDTQTPLAGIVEVAVARAYACARASGGDVWCWGEDDGGALGNLPALSPYARKVPL